MRGKLLALLPEGGKLRKLVINIASLFSMQVANMLLPLLTVPYVSRVIGPEKLGLLSLSLVYNGYFVILIDFGFNISVVRLIAANKSNKAYINRIFSEILIAKIGLLVLSIVIFITASVMIPAFREHLILHLFTCSYCLGTVLFPQWLYQGMEDLDKLAIFSFVSRLLLVIGILTLVRKPEDYFYQNLLTGLVHIGVSSYALKVAFKRYSLRFIIPNRVDLFLRYREASAIFMSSVASNFYNSSHVFMLGSLGTAYAVGVFSAASRLEAIVRTFVSIVINQALLPVIASKFGTSREQGLNMVRQVTPFILVLTAFIGVMLIISAPFLVNLLYGKQFLDAVIVLRFMAVLPLLVSTNNLLGLYTMLNLRMDKAFFIISFTGTLCGIILNILLISKASFLGAAVSWIVTEFSIIVMMWTYLRYKGVSILKEGFMLFPENFQIFKSKLIYKKTVL